MPPWPHSPPGNSSRRAANAPPQAASSSVARPAFIARQVQASSHGLIIHPTALILAGEGNARRNIQPWINSARLNSAFVHPADATPGPADPRPYATATELGIELLLQGAKRLAQRGWPGWERGIHELEERGYHRMASQLHQSQTDTAKSISLLKLWRLGLEALPV